jgi:hypothetical protein
MSLTVRVVLATLNWVVDTLRNPFSSSDGMGQWRPRLSPKDTRQTKILLWAILLGFGDNWIDLFDSTGQQSLNYLFFFWREIRPIIGVVIIQRFHGSLFYGRTSHARKFIDSIHEVGGGFVVLMAIYLTN